MDRFAGAFRNSTNFRKATRLDRPHRYDLSWPLSVNFPPRIHLNPAKKFRVSPDCPSGPLTYVEAQENSDPEKF